MNSNPTHQPHSHEAHVASFRIHNFRLAGFFGFLGVALGAFGAHGLQALFAEHPQAQEMWKTAVMYQLIHAVLLLAMSGVNYHAVIAGRQPLIPRNLIRLFAIGIALFCGGLYIFALTQNVIFSFLVLLGGISMLVGWIWLMWLYPRKKKGAE